MEKIRAWIRMFFGFSRTETNAFLILLPLLSLIMFSEPLYRKWSIQSNRIDFMREQPSLDSMIARLQWNLPDSNAGRARPEIKIKFHSFNPNLATGEEFKNLGLPPYLAQRVVRFREKGGSFKIKTDLLKIYGMDSSWYAQVESYIHIPTTIVQAKEAKPLSRKKTFEPMDLNLADSIQLMHVYGIGPSLSKRIKLYREKLGGFISMEQLKEVYGLDTAVIKKMNEYFYVQENFTPRKINLNTDVSEEFFKHPYFRRNQGNVIQTYRRQHGEYKSVDDLKNIAILSPDWIEKVRPYLKVE